MKAVVLAVLCTLVIVASANELKGVKDCLTDVAKLVKLVPTLREDLNQGNLIKLMLDGSIIVNTFKAVERECKNLNAVQAQAAELGDNVENTQKCLGDIVLSIPVVKKVIADFNHSDFLALLSDVESVHDQVKSIEQDCQNLFKANKSA
eukprot:TRINITY_DN1384_c0_g1_i1.p1 TRINITY_DN1384_c0_g1~~TRINITY_DN1384_c0_g1_i1.p1  ORF type:complete len:149 (+),score=48.41 TRINITY_DN1384_c0_g1_i1:128-574(+)